MWQDKKRLSGPCRSRSETGRRTFIFLDEKAFDYIYVKSVMQPDPLEKPSEKKEGGGAVEA